MKKLLILTLVSLAHVSVLAADYKTDSTVIIDGIVYDLQHWTQGTDYKAVMVGFAGGVARLPPSDLTIDKYVLKTRPVLSSLTGSVERLYVRRDYIRRSGSNAWYLYPTYIWGVNAETIVLPPEQLSFTSSNNYPFDHSFFRDCKNLKRVVMGPVPLATVASSRSGVATESIRDAVWRAEELYYPVKYQEEWERILKMIPCKCKYGAFEGDEWTGLDCVVPGSGNLAESGTSETPSVVTNVVTYYASVTNVHVHYVSDGDHPTFLNPPTTETGFVNAITEINGGFVSIPESWADNYDGFKEKFGEDFSVALAKPTGKHDQQGNPLFVWQDYVAGTNPVDENDVFRATVTIDGDKVIVSYSPKLDAERAAMRKYTIWGKKSLMEKDWIAVPEGGEANYNFFKVSVEMKSDGSSNQ